jgi:hypothetical protein
MPNEKYTALKKAHNQAVIDELRNSTILPNPGEAVSALEHAIIALEKLSHHISGMGYEDYRYCEVCGRKGLTPEEAGKTLAYMAKVVNELTRLFEFAKGKPDSRTEVMGLNDLMRLLSNEQFVTLTGWLEAGTDAEVRGSH